MFTIVGFQQIQEIFVFTEVGFHLNSGFTKILCTPIFPLPQISYFFSFSCFQEKKKQKKYVGPKVFLTKFTGMTKRYLYLLLEQYKYDIKQHFFYDKNLRFATAHLSYLIFAHYPNAIF